VGRGARGRGLDQVRAAVLHEFGATPVPGEFADPEPSDGLVVVGVRAAGMNPVDISIASGRFYGPQPTVPCVVGREGVGHLTGGERVLFAACVPPFGSFAQQALVDPAMTVALPEAIDDATAIALWTAGLAAWIPLTRMARINPGERVLVLGASGVVGQIAVQAARILGAGRVVAAARSEDGRRRATELGADATVRILEGSGRFETEDSFDVILDLLWGEPAAAALKTLAPRGRLVQVGSAAGIELPIAAPTLRSRNASLIGYTSALVPQAERAAAYLKLVGHAVAGRIVIDSEAVPLERVAEAWAHQQQGPHRKIVVIP
jgi:NADPH:quinone reductase-like Zn-dependent oxidoreductase